jgi:hypothetical protein
VSLFSRLRDIVLSPPRDQGPDDVVPVALPEGEEVAGLWKGMLESQGIPAMIRDVSPLYRGYMNWAAEYELCVRRRDLDRARAVLGVTEEGVVAGRRR